MNNKGLKQDKGKAEWHLLPLSSIREIVLVLTFGAKKYKENNWKYVKDGKKRYYNACMRHIDAWQSGNKIDKESGLSALAHTACCLIFIMWFEQQERE